MIYTVVRCSAKPQCDLCTTPATYDSYGVRGCRGWGRTFLTSSYMAYTTSKWWRGGTISAAYTTRFSDSSSTWSRKKSWAWSRKVCIIVFILINRYVCLFWYVDIWKTCEDFVICHVVKILWYVMLWEFVIRHIWYHISKLVICDIMVLNLWY